MFPPPAISRDLGRRLGAILVTRTGRLSGAWTRLSSGCSIGSRQDPAKVECTKALESRWGWLRIFPDEPAQLPPNPLPGQACDGGTHRFSGPTRRWSD